MNNDQLLSWVVSQWKRQTPLARSIRNAKAQDRALKLEYKKRLRSLASQHGAKMRGLKMKQAVDAQVLREKRAVRDAERERDSWDFLIRHG